MQALRDHDVAWRQGRAFRLVLDAGDEVRDLPREAYSLFFTGNGLSPTAFPSLGRFKTEVVTMTAGQLGGGPQAVGKMPWGGTKSLLLGVKTARDWGRAERGVARPEKILLRLATLLYILNWITFDLVALILPFLLISWIAGAICWPRRMCWGSRWRARRQCRACCSPWPC